MQEHREFETSLGYRARLAWATEPGSVWENKQTNKKPIAT